MRELLTTWFSLSRPIGQRFYAVSGFALVGIAALRSYGASCSTWYRNNLFPQIYWNLWSDALIHRIHRRVLDHVKRRSGGPTLESP
ncbi:MAG TPA: hypothetical protein VLF14_05060 [Candidatus Binatia bacterium]|nr:hypothetical protein [Candidatus Binatia bacterium]